jgi:predicted TIM-barrel fold metal-dependent hydrolase
MLTFALFLQLQSAAIIDVHMHALHYEDQGPAPVPVCAGEGTLTPPRDQAHVVIADLMTCPHPLRSGASDDEIMRRTIAIMKKYNVVGVLSGDDMRLTRTWKKAAPERFIVGTTEAPGVDSVRAWITSGELHVIGELAFQYAGISPGDSVADAWYALAEQKDVPLAIHVGPGPPGAPYFAAPAYRMRFSHALQLEDALLRHPKMRIDVMHAGWPMIEETMALMWAHPQVYVDIGVLSWAIPKAEFYTTLRRLVEAGFGRRILFGSDQMVWPEALEIAIRRVQAAPFLTAAQKRDIFHDNAMRWLRM